MPRERTCVVVPVQAPSRATPRALPRPGPRPEDALQDPFDPDAMTPEQRERELAALLATGYLRHRAMRAPGAASTCVPGPDERGRQRENEVDGIAEQSVHVPHADGSAPPAEQEART